MTHPLAEILGVRIPLIQAPMAGSQGSALALAVAREGALGSLPCAMLGEEALVAELGALKASGLPYNLNFFSHTPPAADAAREAAWRARLAPAYARFGIDPETIPAGPGRHPFSAAIADLVAPFAPPVVSFHFGLPSDALLARVRAWGAKVLGCATTLAEARWLVERGVDAVIAQGLEAGGHRGLFLDLELDTQVGTLPLVRQLARAIDRPVIAAGGSADAPAVKAALAAGAAGVQVGTAFLLCPEATTSAVHRAALKSPAATHTALTNLFTGRPARGIVNGFMREFGPLNPAAPAFPLATASSAPLRAAAERAGSGEFSPLWSGQDAGGCREIPAGELARQLMKGFG